MVAGSTFALVVSNNSSNTAARTVEITPYNGGIGSPLPKPFDIGNIPAVFAFDKLGGDVANKPLADYAKTVASHRNRISDP